MHSTTPGGYVYVYVYVCVCVYQNCAALQLVVVAYATPYSVT